MNIFGIGIDIAEIYRIKDILEKNNRFINKIFTENERKYFESKNFRVETIAGNFAAKEAISKALGTGIRNFEFKDIEVIRDEKGKPIVKTYNNLEKICIDYNVLEIKVSISHSDNYAVANAIVIVKE
ncbi:4'-phosphopantetheinyl transferase [[Clostridium] sordellii]|uniref:Holo-[acyl-carrier-protein] synthase n=1 Tax=Paraclostridium sordellii TaxID=1505 RepID=A0A9P1KZE6_PARSO|nr:MULTISPECIES: holo-ACP synthase [Paeniclostridium]EPZ53441.1 holo-[acyl-carrier-protein] synthase [[Clostridium] sordellii ATCC 9714] [Paeniclostridium sordellii ATCC 9714]MDU5019445.1 holo-ACP synthase [Clostridiales bacterium]AUN12968.1 holo-ACP synthase [Paeniclostridium sordellii]MBS6025081.1 holo-ACP synthase [Paeniclostridium sordellii]MBW4863943.1 holo-ACP synthase [Paeniclostridium sp.]